jgi:hypothetical protein
LLLLVGTLLAAFMLISVLCLVPLASQPNQRSSSAAVAQAALQLEQHLFGPLLNEYTPSDAFLQRVESYWLSLCHTPSGGLCSVAVSGNLQCVEFVAAAQWLAGHPLPAIVNAENFWPIYVHEPGWHEIPSPSSFPHATPQAPQVGDLMVWQGGEHLEQQADGTWKEVEYGHLAVITQFEPPAKGTDGKMHDGHITVAEANALPAGRTLVIHPDYTVDPWGPITLGGIHYSGETVLGYLEATASPPTVGLQDSPTPSGNAQSLPTGLSFSMPYVQEAWDDARAASISPRSFVAQIRQESGFNPNAVSSAGAIGIAQFMPATAEGLGIDPYDPHASLRAAASYMAQKDAYYQGNDALALAAYNAGDDAVQSAVARCRNAWLSWLPAETQHYVTVILP